MKLTLELFGHNLSLMIFNKNHLMFHLLAIHLNSFPLLNISVTTNLKGGIVQIMGFKLFRFIGRNVYFFGG